ncbi:PQQ-binding-like beta-propeller repeat protein [Halorubrum laminariae]|uniref:PQQ-binding-like beta-propeller repeat protein n=1 Tax=Halorubrum laminariae TaxID=1433523 RepID=A0ABD6C1H5_9EURY|nr:PQQ-binding-like beta-propeller repeat protein [Halorubrum laminariae]
MSNQKRTLTVLVVAIAALAVAGVGFGMVSGQILSEETYYEEEFENTSHVDPDQYELEEMDEMFFGGTRENDARVALYRVTNDGSGHLWRTRTNNNGRIAGIAVIDDGSMVAHTDTDRNELRMRRADTGELVWSVSDSSRHLRATSDGKLITSSAGGRVSAYSKEVNESTGDPDQYWQVNINPDIRFTKIHPDGDKMYYGGHAGVGLLNLSDGSSLWHIDQSNPTSDAEGSIFSGAIEPDSGDLFYHDRGDKMFKRVDDSGSLVAEYPDSTGNDYYSTMHIGPRGYIFAHGDDAVHKFSQTFSEEWAHDVGNNPRADVDTMTVDANQNVYTGTSTNGGRWYKIDGETGDLKWRYRPGSSNNDETPGTGALNSLNENFGFPNYQGQPDTQDASELDSIDGFSGAVYNPGFWSTQSEPTLSAAGDITRSFSESAITEDGVRNVYVIATVETGNEPVDASIRQFGQEVGSGSISGNSRSELTVEFEPQTHEFDYTLSSDTAFEIVDLKLVTLQETTEGDPLTAEGPVVLDADQGYDRTVGVLISALDISTTHLLIIVMIALVVGFMVFTYTKSVRGQELAQSLLFGAIIAGVVIIGVVPTFNLASWVFTGDIDRAPLANPALEAEPPTYYSTEFQDGTMNGWQFDYQRSSGEARPVSVGETFNLDFSGTPNEAGAVRYDEHISLGNALDTGFVDVRGIASGQSGLVGPVHETTMNMRVYVTEDGNLESGDMLDPDTNYVREEGDNIDTFVQNHEHAVAVEEVALSFNGEVVTNDHMVTFPLEGEYVHVVLVASDNRDDVAAEAQLAHVRIGATVEGIGEQGE